MLDTTEISDVLSDEGALAAEFDYFRSREQQVKLAVAISEAINDQVTTVLEAGSGIGKSYAYMVPAILSGKQVIISTSTKGLQEQLFGKDIPTLAKALGIHVAVRLLKGRNNYICKHRLEQTRENRLASELFPDDPYVERDLLAIEEYAQESSDGDRAGVKKVKSFSRIWPLVTSNSSNCTGRKCKYFSDCFVFQEREKARNAQIVIVNHALLLSDASWRRDTGEEGMLLQNREVIVFDEAHTLPEDLPKFFSKKVSTSEAIFNAREASAWFERYMPEQQEIVEALESIEVTLEALNVMRKNSNAKAISIHDFLAQEELSSSLSLVAQNMTSLSELMKELTEEEDEDSDARLELQSMAENLASKASLLETWQLQEQDHVAWAEPLREGWMLWRAPVDTSSLFDEYFSKKATCLLLSASMAFDNELEGFKDTLGLKDANDLIVSSPFDYVNKSILLLPDRMPDPNKSSESFLSKLADIAARLIVSNDGAAFLLFSSWNNLQITKSNLQENLDKRYKLLVQGDSPPDKLVQAFRTARQPSVLLGTRTFWQGVDVRGSALSLVIVDRIPFTPPDDPFSLAQKALYGSDVLFDIQLQRATLVLKQAAGRLIRSEEDRGVLVICDPRMRSRGYGEKIRRNMLPMTETNDIEEAAEFLSTK